MRHISVGVSGAATQAADNGIGRVESSQQAARRLQSHKKVDWNSCSGKMQYLQLKRE